ncbi:MAG: mechanosensitive ion channel [Clostridia bacterium]|nr:mechanosensitive ion channel [Oscillospiraceae bacterium]MBR4892791.1 mechanosensitive ion channel [Clostridia bacterium]
MDTQKILDFLFELFASLGLKIIAAVIILFVGSKLIKFIKKWIKTSSKLEKIDMGVRTFLGSFLGITLYAILFITIAMVLGIPTTSFVTALASCGVAIGLALQGALGNLAGGLMILIFKPFKVGDYIDTSSTSGTVTNITIMYTVLTTPDNKVITVPNGILTNSVIENYSASDERRVDLTFATGYECDIEKVKEILLSVANKNEKVIKEPVPFARLVRHGDNSLEYTLRVWCKASDYWDVNFDLIETVKKEFDLNNISIPYPQMDIHIDNVK